MTDGERLAYLAGIVDGEGSLELKLQRSGSLDLVLHGYNSDIPLRDWIVLHFGGKRYDIHRRMRVEKPQWQPMFNWNLSGQVARDLLELLAPYMVIKRAQAEHAIDAWDNRQPMPRSERRWGTGTPGAVIEMRGAAVTKMHDLNRKNRGA